MTPGVKIARLLGGALVVCCASSCSSDGERVRPEDAALLAGECPSVETARELAETAILELLARSVASIDGTPAELERRRPELAESIHLLGDLERASFAHGDLDPLRRSAGPPELWVWRLRSLVVFRDSEGRPTGQTMRWTVFLREGRVVDQGPGILGEEGVTYIDLSLHLTEGLRRS